MIRKWYISAKMITRWLSIPLAIIAAYGLYDTWKTGDNNLAYLLPAVLLLAIIWVMGPQINFWWSQRNTPKLEPPAVKFLEQYSTFYQSLTEEQQQTFRDRVVLIRMAKDFKSQAKDDMPEEVRIAFSASLAQLTFGQEDFLLPQYETVVIYPAPFPSPAYPKDFHASETFDEDGVFLFAAQQFLNGFTNPRSYYQICLHELAVGYTRVTSDRPWPEVSEDLWPQLTQISGFSREQIEQWINRPDVELLAVAIVHYLVFPKAFLEQLPELYGQLRACFDTIGTGGNEENGGT